MARGHGRGAQEKMTAPLSKPALRAQIGAILKTMPPEQRRADSKALCARLAEQPFFQSAKAVLFFAPLPNEADIWPLLEQALAMDKVVALPCFDADRQVYRSRRIKNLRVEIVSGRFGIREPVAACVEIPLADLDLVLVPGVAFDLAGNRLGRGKGFYDRLLQDFEGTKCGIALEEQVVERVPAEKNDVRMDLILTPARCVKAK